MTGICLFLCALIAEAAHFATCRTATSTLYADAERTQLLVEMLQSESVQFKAIFDELPIESAFVVFTRPPGGTPSNYLAWHPWTESGQSQPLRNVIVKTSEKPLDSFTGSFVAFLTDQQADDLLIFEDVRNSHNQNDNTPKTLTRIFPNFF